MNQLEKRILMSSVVLSGVLFVPQNVWGMHIMEGYLPPMYLSLIHISACFESHFAENRAE